MKELNFENGLQEYKVKDCLLYFNPADPSFADRIYTAFDALNEKQKKQSVDTEKLSTKETFEYLRQLDAEMREVIDGVFEQEVCKPLFGSMSLYASAGGSPVWMNFMLAIIDELDESIKREKAFHSEKLSKYTKKYHR